MFLAFDSRLDRLVVPKVPAQRHWSHRSCGVGFCVSAGCRKPVAPNLITVYEIGEEGPLCYIASSYFAGPTLANG